MREITVALPGRPYSVWVGSGALGRIGEFVALTPTAELCGVITDANVAALHGARASDGLARLPLRIEQLTLEPGERTKTPETLARAWRWLADIGAHRSDVIIALGGGVVGDLAGFVAATYHRGIGFVQAPTSLLAQVDASIGGKTGVDLPEGKNLAGSFHQPLAVVADIDVLGTLPEAEFATGMAEVIKHALIAGDGSLERIVAGRDALLARAPDMLTDAVADAAAVKARIVAADETEHGERAHLNYGHTLGHALETLEGYTRWTHGQAVAIGMMFAAHLAAALGLGDRVEQHRAALAAYELPTGGAAAEYEAVAAAWTRDKKYEAGMRFVVLEDVGRPTVVREVPEDALRKAYEAVRP